MSLKKPLLIYDGECVFCGRWIARWKILTGDKVEYAPYQEVANQFPDISAERFQRSVQFVEPEGNVTGGAEAVFRALSYAPGKRWMLWLYQTLPGFRRLCEWFYRLVASNRILFSKLTIFFWGRCLEPSTYFFSRWIFLKSLGIAYLIAFVSLAVQI